MYVCVCVCVGESRDTFMEKREIRSFLQRPPEEAGIWKSSSWISQDLVSQSPHSSHGEGRILPFTSCSQTCPNFASLCVLGDLVDWPSDKHYTETSPPFWVYVNICFYSNQMTCRLSYVFVNSIWANLCIFFSLFHCFCLKMLVIKQSDVSPGGVWCLAMEVCSPCFKTGNCNNSHCDQYFVT